MLDTSSKNMASELLAGEELRDKRLSESRKIVAQYHTCTYEGSPALDVPENHAFEYISLIVPQLIFENPGFLIRQEDMGPLEAAMNRWSKLQNLREVGIDLAVDQCFSWGVARIDQQVQAGWIPGQVNRNGSQDLPRIPVVRRVPQHRFNQDPLCLKESQARWKSQLVVRDQGDLLSEAERFPDRGWNKAAIKQMTTGTELRKARPNREGVRSVDRKEVCFYEVWIPEEELDESLGPQFGMHGTIRTIACGRADDEFAEIRKPRPYYGPAEGPFVLFGTHVVPDEPWPLSAMYPVQTQVRDLNNHGVSIREAAARHKKIGLGDAMNPADSERIKNAKNGDFLLVNGLDKQKVVELSVGGIDEAMLVYRNFARDLLDKASAMSDALRGNVTGDATAYENAVAQGASDVRAAFVKRQYQAGMRAVGRRGGWYLFHDERSRIPLENGDVFQGGSGKDAADAIRKQYPGIEIPDDFVPVPRVPFDHLDIDLEPTAMERQDQATMQRNELQLFQIVAQTIPLMAQFPDATNWRARFERLGRAFNDPGLAKSVFPEAATEDLLAMQALGMEAEAGPQGAGAGGSQGGQSFSGRHIGQPPKQGQKQDQLRMQRRIERSGSNPKVRPATGTARNKASK
jgi:hypothetical protein